MPNSLRWPDAALAGLASSMRTFAGPATLAVRGQIAGKPRIGLLVAAAGELATDKTSAATDRSDLPALGGRIAAGVYTGNRLAGPAGAAAAVLGAGVGTYSTWRIRKLVVDTTGLPDPVIAVAEDIVAYGAAAIATRADFDGDEPAEGAAAGATAPDPYAAAGTDGPAGVNGATPSPAASSAPSDEHSLLGDAARGLFAGVVGTAVMTVAQGAEFVLFDASPSSTPADVTDKIKRRAGLGKLKRKHRRAANQGMHWLYGTSWGVPYGIIAGSTRGAPELTGPAWGLVVWAAALAHQPALGIAEVPWKRSLQSLGSEALFHLAYGVGLGAAWRALANGAK